MKIVTCIAPVNIAVIKYWGKRDEDLILPLNDSISCTLSTDFMSTKTTVIASPDFKEDKLWLNGKEESLDNKRLTNCLKEVKRRAAHKSSEILQWRIHICSENNFPTAAGLASSAAGYACLVYALATLYEVEGDISSIARQGSGSACRSIYGGWVRWHKGEKTDGTDSIATQIVPSSYWPEIRILILVVDDSRKKYSSTNGMKRCVETSQLLKCRVNSIPEKVKEIIESIKDKDFHKFTEITMRDSNQFHATCLDTYPPCVYLSDTSHAIIDLVHTYNSCHGTNKVAYTFDAGPNACLYLQEVDVEEFLSVIRHVFPPPNKEYVEYIRGIPANPKLLSQDIASSLGLTKNEPGLLKYIIHTKPGDGPKVLTDDTEHLLNASGLPLKQE